LGKFERCCRQGKSLFPFLAVGISKKKKKEGRKKEKRKEKKKRKKKRKEDLKNEKKSFRLSEIAETLHSFSFSSSSFSSFFPLLPVAALFVFVVRLISEAMSKSKEEILWQACTDGDFEVARKLADDPSVDVNGGDPEHGRTPFYRASLVGPVSWRI